MQPERWKSSPEVFPSTADLSTRVTRAARRGELRQLHGRIYTTNLADPLEAVVRRNRWKVAGLLFPGAVVSHRSALAEFAWGAGADERGDFPVDGTAGGRAGAEARTLFLTGAYDRIVQLPGLRIRQMAGPGPLTGDRPMEGSLHRASPARALLECLSVRRVRGPGSPGLPADRLRAEVEWILEEGITGRALLRDAGELAAPLRAGAAIERLGHLLAECGGIEVSPPSRGGAFSWNAVPVAPRDTHPDTPRDTRLDTPPGALRDPHPPAPSDPSPPALQAAGRAPSTPLPPSPRAHAPEWDGDAIRRLEELREALAPWNPPPRTDLARSGTQWTTLAFLDAWGSCALEGRAFDPAEVERAVFQRRITPGREGDVAILLGSWRLLASPVEMTFSARDRSAEGFVTQLHRHHRGIFPRGTVRGGGPTPDGDADDPGDPGVEPERIHPTLLRGYDLYRTLGEPLQRAAFLLCLITEVRPFADGTGVVARATMNAELVAAGERRILFAPAPEAPYLPALDHFRREGDARPLLRLLEEAQARSAALDVRNRLGAAREVAAWGSEPRRRWPRFTR